MTDTQSSDSASTTELWEKVGAALRDEHRFVGEAPRNTAALAALDSLRTRMERMGHDITQLEDELVQMEEERNELARECR
jgi:uncharacterized protein YabN with tetrapyrrole methylase and pyrophosphatase domain